MASSKIKSNKISAVGTSKRAAKHKPPSRKPAKVTAPSQAPADALPATITIRAKTVEASKPLVVSFPGGVPDSKVDLLWQGGTEMVGWDRHCSYRSERASRDRRHTKLCVGVLNKRTGVMRLQEAASDGAVITLVGSVPSYLELQKKKEEKGDSDPFQDFGSAKKRKVIRSKAANRVDLDYVVGGGAKSALMKSIQSGDTMSKSNTEALQRQIKSNEEAEAAGLDTLPQGWVRRSDANAQAQEVARKLLLPPYNKDADNAKEAYPPKEILGPEVWAELNRTVGKCRRQSGVTNKSKAAGGGDKTDDTSDNSRVLAEAIFNTDKQWEEHIKECILSIEPGTKYADVRYAAGIMLHYMIRFYKKHNNKLIIRPIDISSPYHFGVPMEYAPALIERFTEPAAGDKPGHVMQKNLQDRLLAHILILYLHVQGGPAMKVTNVTPLAVLLTRTPKDLSAIYRLVGCTVANKDSMLTVVLKVPLVFPDMAGGGRKQKR